jgi:hypothetical protein
MTTLSLGSNGHTGHSGSNAPPPEMPARDAAPPMLPRDTTIQRTVSINPATTRAPMARQPTVPSFY